MQSIEHSSLSTALVIFVAIISAEHPEQASALMKYGHSIREMAARGMDWIFYDDEFRRLHSGNKSTPWAELHMELYLRAYKADDKTAKLNRHIQKHRPQQSGLCWAAKTNSGMCKRFNCPFRHSCPKCQGNHSVHRCRIGRQQPANTNQHTNIN